MDRFFAQGLRPDESVKIYARCAPDLPDKTARARGEIPIYTDAIMFARE